MQLRKFLNKAGNLDEELKFIDYRIAKLGLFGKTMINCDIVNGDIIMETLPNNGARPIISPIYPANNCGQPLEMVHTGDNTSEAEVTQPVGFQRVYIPNELQNTGLLTIFFELDRNTLLAMIDTTIIKLKNRRKQILTESKILLKESL
jgi:hypothetical protein